MTEIRTDLHTPIALYLCDDIYELRWDLWDSRRSPKDPDTGAAQHGTSNDVNYQGVRMCFGVVVVYYWSFLETENKGKQTNVSFWVSYVKL